jgi:hypothetical protein
MKENKNYFYIKSAYTGQVHKVTEMPKFGGWVLSNENEFNDYYLSKGIDPKTVWHI